MKTLRLTLTKKWFDMIFSGEKKEEYRAIRAYWFNRLVFQKDKVLSYHGKVSCNDYVAKAILGDELMRRMVGFIPFDYVEFTNGYSPSSPRFTIECKGIEIGKGKQEWGAEPDTDYFIIKLGEIITPKN